MTVTNICTAKKGYDIPSYCEIGVELTAEIPA